MKVIDILDIEGFKIGHAQNFDAATGCSVIICKEGATAGVDVRGGAPGTRETDLLDPVNLVEQIHAVLLTGGSAFGLDAAAGVMSYLEEHDIGFDVSVTKVPIVCGAALFDLTIGKHDIRPDKRMGFEACRDSESGKSKQGCIGAGTGATAGKILGMDKAIKSGLGSYAVQIGELKIGAIVAVNCLGDVIDPEAGIKLAGPLDDDLKSFLDTEEIMIKSFSDKTNLFSGNTTIGAVITNAKLTKSQTNKLASMSHNGYARTMRPAHSMYDGDSIFALSCGDVKADLSTVGLLAARAMERAVVSSVKSSESMSGLKCSKALRKND